MDLVPAQIADDLRGLFRGALHFDALTRGLYATDASAFQVAPLAVAVPEDADDVAVLVRYCFEHNLPLIPRGGGTGMAGESLGPAVVLDMSVKFRRILDVTGATITAESGVTCAALNAELGKDGLRFAPDPASAETCTIGGMVATNASGGNSFRFGYTREYVEGLRVVWDSGDADLVGRESGDRKERAGRTEQIARAVGELLTTHAGLIGEHRSRTPFDRCGYQLQNVLSNSGPDLAKLLVGSEGTLGVVTAVTLRAVPLPGGTVVVLLGFPNLDAAVRAGLDLRAFNPIACDLLDKRLLSVTHHSNDGFGLIPPAIGAALLVTFEADTEREAIERAWGMVESLRTSHVLRVLAEPTSSPEGLARVRGVRAAAVAGLQSLGRGPRPLPFIEDVGVPVHALPEYLAGVQDILKRSEVSASFLIHALTGQVHTRPLVDLDNPVDRVKLWPLAESVHTLALSLGGSVSSQHGIGLARTPWVERQSGPLYPILRELKRVFDPKNLLNPGKIVGPDPSREAWPLRPGLRSQEPGARDRETGTNGITPPATTPLLVWKDTSPAAEVARCSGCGDCRTARARCGCAPSFVPPATRLRRRVRRPTSCACWRIPPRRRPRK